MTTSARIPAQPVADPAFGTVTEPIPQLTSTPRWRDAFAALGAHNYRLYTGSMLFANVGGWMARIAIDWLVLELTGNVALVGLAVTLQFAPTLLIGPWAGVISDRFPRHRTLILTQSVGTLANAALAALVLTGRAEAWQVFLAATVTGVSMAVDGPSRSAFVSELVGTRRLRTAISLNATIFHFSGFIGPAISGALIVVVGSGWSIAVNAATSFVAVLCLLLMRTHELQRIAAPAHRSRGAIREALRYAAAKPTIVWPLVMLAAVAVFGMNLPVLFTASADHHYRTGAAGYGLYSSLAAAGAFIGAVLSARRRTLRLRTIVLATVGYGAVTAAAGVAPWYPLFLAALLGIGVTRLTFATSAESMTQLSTNLAIRGRIMSFYLMTVTGGQALGGVLMGWIAESFGPQCAFLVAGGVPMLVGLAGCAILARSRGLRLRVTPRRGIRIVHAG